MGKPTFYTGYKGKGMCSACAWRSNGKNPSGKYTCSRYGSACQLVCRNCPGIPMLRIEIPEPDKKEMTWIQSKRHVNRVYGLYKGCRRYYISPRNAVTLVFYRKSGKDPWRLYQQFAPNNSVADVKSWCEKNLGIQLAHDG